MSQYTHLIKAHASRLRMSGIGTNLVSLLEYKRLCEAQLIILDDAMALAVNKEILFQKVCLK